MTSPPPLRAAVIGCGLIGSEFADGDSVGIYTHVGAYAACPDTRLVALCDPDPARLQRAGERWQVTGLYSSLDSLLIETQPEIVSLCTPDFTHYPLLQQILQAPSVRAVLAEKPLARNVEQGRELVALAKTMGVRLAVNYSRRYAPGVTLLAQRIRDGELGDIQSISGYYTKGIAHNGTHWLDLARLMVGEVITLRAWNDRAADFEGDPTLSVQLRFANGTSGVLMGLDALHFSLFEMDILGTQGRARLFESGHRLEISRCGPSPRYQGYRELLAEPAIDCDMKDTIPHAVTDLVASLRERREPACTGMDGLHALVMAEAAKTSVAEDGRWVDTATPPSR